MKRLDDLTDEELTMLESGVLLGVLVQTLQAVKQEELLADLTEDQLLEDQFLEIPEEGQDFTTEDGMRAGIIALVIALWRGDLSILVWLTLMALVLRSSLTAAYNEGAASCGIRPGELNAKEITRRDEIVSIQIGFLGGFGEAIVLANRASGNPLAPLLDRAAMWVIRREEAKAEAQAQTCGDQKLEWVWNPLKEHCTDCRNYNGRVYRASTWARYNIRPRSSELECGGFRCGCTFQPTDAPVTPGRPPNPTFF